MIKVENVLVDGWQTAIRGMRNPMNSWDKSDSTFEPMMGQFGLVHIGQNDLELMMKLRNAGTDHRKFMRMINVSMDITAPLYWWKEYDTYKVGTVANSCSTMHKIQAKEFTLDDFSYDHLVDDTNSDDWATITDEDGQLMDTDGITCLSQTIKVLNDYREKFLETRDKKYWWQLIQLLPSSYNQRRTVTLNYEVLANIYHSRKAHKLDEWQSLCQLIEQLPYSKLIKGE